MELSNQGNMHTAKVCDHARIEFEENAQRFGAEMETEIRKLALISVLQNKRHMPKVIGNDSIP